MIRMTRRISDIIRRVKGILNPDSQELGFSSFSLDGLTKGTDYIILSKTYFDGEGEEYLTDVDLHRGIKNKAFASYQIVERNGTYTVLDAKSRSIVSSSRNKEEMDKLVNKLTLEYAKHLINSLEIRVENIDTNNVYGVGDTIDLFKAKLCGLGVIQITTGSLTGKQFIYVSSERDSLIQILAYQALANNSVHPIFYDLLDDTKARDYIKLVLGDTVFSQVVEQASQIIGGKS